MKAVILAGGMGTCISDESHLRPKPMIEIGDQPILWHIMKYYSHFGFNEFIICCGCKGYVIKEYFADYYLHRSDVTFDFSAENRMTVHQNVAEPWRVTLVDTGLNTQTGGRFGVLDLEGETITGFREKAQDDSGWINGGFMVVEPGACDYLSADERCILERGPLQAMAQDGKLGIYKHTGFWQCMDTPRDRGRPERLWSVGTAPWKVWGNVV